MAVTAKMFTKFVTSMANKEVDINTDTLKCALFTSALTASQTNDQYFNRSPYTSNEVSQANGYTTGGATVATPTFSTSGKTWTMDAVNPAWTVTSTGFGYKQAVFYYSLAATPYPLVCIVDMGATVTAAAGTHTIVLDSSGIATVTVA